MAQLHTAHFNGNRDLRPGEDGFGPGSYRVAERRAVEFINTNFDRIWDWQINIYPTQLHNPHRPVFAATVFYEADRPLPGGDDAVSFGS